MSRPLVTVLMTVYNGEKYLPEAIESILNQTLDDFEFLIVNDGSTDKSREIIESYEDSRIKLINQENSGVGKAANKGIDIASGKYVARMDSDDISRPKRLEAQVAYMEANPNVGICGTAIETFGIGKSRTFTYPSASEDIKITMLFESPFAQPSVIINRSLLDKYSLRYDPQLSGPEDYDLWARSSEFFDLANLDEVLLLYRKHPGQLTSTKVAYLNNVGNGIRKTLLEKMFDKITNLELSVHNAISSGGCIPSEKFVNDAHDWLIKLKSVNDRKRKYDESHFNKLLAEKWFFVCKNATSQGWRIWRKFQNSSLASYANIDAKQKTLFLLNSFFHIGRHRRKG